MARDKRARHTRRLFCTDVRVAGGRAWGRKRAGRFWLAFQDSGGRGGPDSVVVHGLPADALRDLRDRLDRLLAVGDPPAAG